ncbi:MAG: hypothetical protein ABI972_19095 [Acidobacteriota bacterium]
MYASGGYHLARRLQAPVCRSPELLPSHVLSASECISEFLPDCWAIEWSSETGEERSTHASHFGIAPQSLPAVISWATGEFCKSFGWPNVFYTLEAAREARARFIPGTPDVVLIGLGLHKSLVSQFLEDAQPDAPKPGCAPVGETGVYQCVKSGQHPTSGGTPRGFEMLATCYGLLTCSWLCNGLEKVCAEQLGIRPNPHGFVETFEDAMRCTNLIVLPETHAEPGLWLPWLITEYPA